MLCLHRSIFVICFVNNGDNTQSKEIKMENQIIQDLGNTLAQLLPDVQRKVKSLKDFTIFSGAILKVKAPPALKDLVDANSWYITMKFDGTATREDAKKVFEYTMVEKLGLPRTQQNLDDEILPKADYGHAPSNAPQLAAPASSTSSADVVDIDDGGNVRNDIAVKTPLAAVPTSKYYAVEFKIIGAPRATGRLGGPAAGRLGHRTRRSWAPQH